MPKARDLTGQTFGRLTALYPTKKRDRKGSIFWMCHCECGNETEARSDDLLSGNNVSCGCKKKELQKGVCKNLTFVEGTCIDYLRSRKSRSDNKSGYRGVYKLGDRYRVSIGFKGKRYYLGTYDTYEEAVRTRQDAEEALHGTYLKLYDWWSEKAAVDPVWAEENPLDFQVKVVDKEIRISSPLMN